LTGELSKLGGERARLLDVNPTPVSSPSSLSGSMREIRRYDIADRISGMDFHRGFSGSE
jgi:hypothetical protein